MKNPIHSFVVSLALILVTGLLKPTHVFGQSEADSFTAEQSIYIELGGTAGRYAVNYGRIFHQKGKLKLNASAVFSLWSNNLDSKTTWLPVVPLELTSFYGKSNHHLEMGVGLTSYLDRTLEFDS